MMQVVADIKERHFVTCVDVFFIGIENESDLEKAKAKLEEAYEGLKKVKKIEGNKLQRT
jgi:hypothetical protein